MMRSTLSPAISPASLVAWRSESLKYAGTVMTASVTVSPRYDSASRLSFARMRAEISCGVYFLPSTEVVQSVPMWRLTEAMVRSTFVTAWRLAVSPTSTSPSLVKATTDGVVRKPSAFAITVGSPPSRTETTELVVPRSIPTARAMRSFSLYCSGLSKSVARLESHLLKFTDELPAVKSIQQILSQLDSTLPRLRVLYLCSTARRMPWARQ